MPLVTANTADLPAESQAGPIRICGAAGEGLMLVPDVLQFILKQYTTWKRGEARLQNWIKEQKPVELTNRERWQVNMQIIHRLTC